MQLREGVEHGEGLLVALEPRGGNEAALELILTLRVLAWDPFLLVVIVEDVLEVAELDHGELGEDQLLSVQEDLIEMSH